MAEMKLDDWQRIVQIAFYVVVIVISVKTYIKAKQGLLNTVNTEYQKRVMDRLKELSETLYAEFDVDSDQFWACHSPIKDEILGINDSFMELRDEILAAGEWYFGTPVTADVQRLRRILGPLESDPFVPEKIRDEIVDLLENRIVVMREIYSDIFDEYTSGLAKGEQQPVTDLDGLNKLHNEAVDGLREQGCGIGQIQDDVHTIRKSIQMYFDSFFPR